MRPTTNYEIVFEGSLEARVAAQLLTESGRADLLDSITPPITRPSIGRLEFVREALDEHSYGSDSAEFTCDALSATKIVQVLIDAAKPTRPGKITFSRRKYMAQALIDCDAKYKSMVEDFRYDSSTGNVVEVGSYAILGADNEQIALLRHRQDFSKSYIAAKGWNTECLSTDQIMEIRNQPEWKNPTD